MSDFRIKVGGISALLILPLAILIASAADCIADTSEPRGSTQTPTAKGASQALTLPSADLTVEQSFLWCAERWQMQYILSSSDSGWSEKIGATGPFDAREFLAYLQSKFGLNSRLDRGVWLFSTAPAERVSTTYHLKYYMGDPKARLFSDARLPEKDVIECEANAAVLGDSVKHSSPFITYMPESRSLFVLALPSQQERIAAYVASKDLPSKHLTMRLSGAANPLEFDSDSIMKAGLKRSVSVGSQSVDAEYTQIALAARLVSETAIRIDGWLTEKAPTDTHVPFNVSLTVGKPSMISNQRGDEREIELISIK